MPIITEAEAQERLEKSPMDREIEAYKNAHRTLETVNSNTKDNDNE